jgi:FecR protein
MGAAMSKQRLADYVTARRSDRELERIWQRLEARDEPPRRRWQVVPFVIAAAALACWLAWPAPPPAPTIAAEHQLAPGDWLATGAERRVIELGDGRWVEVGRDSQLRLVKFDTTLLEVHLERGEVLSNVAIDGGLTVVVVTANPSVTVKGTRFRATLDPITEAFTLKVGEGSAEVVHDGARTLVAQGGSWANEPLSTAPPPPPPSASVAPKPSPPRVGAKTLWTRAQAARLGGEPAQAERLYVRLLQQHPDDARASLAAMELARIRLDSLNDPKGAAEAFELAARRGGGAVVAEDAEAGRVDALDRAGESEACHEARDAFLAKNPKSVHAGRVTGMCKR